MAFSLAKLVTKSVVLFRPVAAAGSCRFLSTDTILRQSDFDPFHYEGTLNLDGRFCNEDIRRVRKVLYDAYCPGVSATRNLARLLNLMDEDTLHQESLGPCRCPRWDVMEDAKALYLVRDMSHIKKKKKVEEVVVKRGCSVFGCVRVDSSRICSIRVIVGKMNPNPGVNNPGYLIDIYLPASVFKEEVWDMEKNNVITKDVKNDILKITIPKKSRDMIRSISTQLKLYK